jgi:hypothetical protein
MMTHFHLAQVNIGRFRAPIDSPIMAGFRDQLDPINALADRSPGFVWRLQTEEGDATAIRPYADDDLMAINMSVWASLEALQQFVYKSHHVQPLRDRDQWFERIEGPILALWWIPIGHTPTVQEATERLAHLKTHGPTPHAFTFRTPFPPPDGRTNVERLDDVFCDMASHDTTPRVPAAIREPAIS